MTTLARILLVCVGLLACAHAHNWMLTPTSRNGNSASTTTPCDQGTKKLIQIGQGQPLSVSWTTNHDGDHSLYWIAAADEAQLETSGKKLGEFPVSTASTKVTIPQDTAPGAYVLQYRWANYRNCADLQVFTLPPGAELADGSTTTFRLANGKGTYDSQTGQYSCDSGYKLVSDGDYKKCEKKVNGAGIAAAVVILLLLAIIFSVVGTYFYLKYHKPEKLAAMKAGAAEKFNKVFRRGGGETSRA